MAEVLSKTSMASWWWNGHKQHHGTVLKTHCIFSSSKRFSSLKLKPQVLRSSSGFHGETLVFGVNKGIHNKGKSLFRAQMDQRWWEREPPKWWKMGLQPNMREVTSVQDLVDSLLNAGDKLVIVDFFAPGCRGCKALHPKIGQLAELNPDVQFLLVNCEDHQSMCYSLKVHVHPFFRFYRGVDGHLCKFSCTNATIDKFKDALAKYNQDRCSLGPTKGLEEKELQALSDNKDLSFTYTPKPVQPVDFPDEQDELEEAEPAPVSAESLPIPPMTPDSFEVSRERTLIITGR